MHTDPIAACGADELPDAKALLRLLSYAFAEANQLGLSDCAAFIDMAANEVQRRMELGHRESPTSDLSRLH